MPLGSITTWQELATKFLYKYFPPAKSAQLKIEISTFRQTDFEQLYEAWERYKELLLRFPNHGFEDWVQIELYYNGLNGQTRKTVDAAAALTTQLAAMNKVSTTEGESAPVVVEESHFPEEVQYINNKNFGGYRGYRELVGTFVYESGKRMARTEYRLDNLETHMANIGASLKILESQVGQITKQLTSQPSGAIQKTADPKLREVNAIFIHHEEIGMIEGKEKKIDRTPSWKISRLQEKETEVRKRFLQLQAEFHKKKGLEDLKTLHSNIQSAEQEEVAFTGGDNKGKQVNLPQKLQDPGEFVVPCKIGGKFGKKAICDSGASVNIMPSSLYEKLGLNRIKPTGLSLQIADKSNVRAILRRPFLATAGAVIDLRQGKLTMEVDGQNVELKASKISYDPP
ncbi:uncharacterized protein LOC142541995 [Primulina tabacum]|uniref:uncharacterized protein LOC142541995 n=1 Tax=Primulina tabacum TaxID=48773 RepID=UPI003F59983F